MASYLYGLHVKNEGKKETELTARLFFLLQVLEDSYHLREFQTTLLMHTLLQHKIHDLFQMNQEVKLYFHALIF